jgi:hypothetical protein
MRSSWHGIRLTCKEIIMAGPSRTLIRELEAVSARIVRVIEGEREATNNCERQLGELRTQLGTLRDGIRTWGGRAVAELESHNPDVAHYLAARFAELTECEEETEE